MAGTALAPPEAPAAGGDPGLLAAVVATSVGMGAMAVLAGAPLRDALEPPACLLGLPAQRCPQRRRRAACGVATRCAAVLEHGG